MRCFSPPRQMSTSHNLSLTDISIARTGQFQAAFANQRLVAQWHLLNGGVDVCAVRNGASVSACARRAPRASLLRRRDDLLVACREIAIVNVVAHSVVEQQRVL